MCSVQTEVITKNIHDTTSLGQMRTRDKEVKSQYVTLINPIVPVSITPVASH